MATARYPGVNRAREGGVFGTHKQDFNAHVTGGDWRHTASQIDVIPALSGGSTVQDNLEAVVPYVLGEPYTVVVSGMSFTFVWNPRTHGARIRLDLSAYNTSVVQSILILQLDSGYTPLPGEVLEIIYYNFPGGQLQVDTSAIMTHLSTYPPEFVPILSDELIRISYGSSIGSGWAVQSRDSLCGGYSGYDQLRKLQERCAYSLFPDAINALDFRPYCVGSYQEVSGYNRRVLIGGSLENGGSSNMAIYLGDGGGACYNATVPTLPGSYIADIAMYGGVNSTTGLAVITEGGSSAAKVLLTTDSGVTWNYSPGNLPISVTYMYRAAVGDILGVTALLVCDTLYNRIFISTDNGVSWHQETLGNSNYVIRGVDFVSGHFVAVGYDSLNNTGRIWRRGTQPAGSGTWPGPNVGVNKRLFDIHQNMAVGENGVVLWAYQGWISFSQRPLLYHAGTLANVYKATSINGFYMVCYGSSTSGDRGLLFGVSSNSGQSFYAETNSCYVRPTGINMSITCLRPINENRKVAFVNPTLHGHFHVTGDIGSPYLLKG
jgi:hypothetical protein